MITNKKFSLLTKVLFAILIITSSQLSYADNTTTHSIDLSKVSSNTAIAPTLEFKEPGYQEIEIINDTESKVILRDIKLEVDTLSKDPACRSIHIEGFHPGLVVDSKTSSVFLVRAVENASASTFRSGKEFSIIYDIIDGDKNTEAETNFIAKINYNDDISFKTGKGDNLRNARNLEFSIDDKNVTKILTIINDNPEYSVKITNIPHPNNGIKIGPNYKHDCQNLKAGGGSCNVAITVTPDAAKTIEVAPLYVTYNINGSKDNREEILSTAAIIIKNTHHPLAHIENTNNMLGGYGSAAALGFTKEAYKEVCKTFIDLLISKNVLRLTDHVIGNVERMPIISHIFGGRLTRKNVQSIIGTLATAEFVEELSSLYPVLEKYLETGSKLEYSEVTGKTLGGVFIKTLVSVVKGDYNDAQLSGLFPGTYINGFICNLAPKIKPNSLADLLPTCINDLTGNLASKVKLNPLADISPRGKYLPEKDEKDTWLYNNRNLVESALKRAKKNACRYSMTIAATKIAEKIYTGGGGNVQLRADKTLRGIAAAAIVLTFTDPSITKKLVRADIPTELATIVIGEVLTIAVDAAFGHVIDLAQQRSLLKANETTVAFRECYNNKCICRDGFSIGSQKNKPEISDL